MENKKNIRKRIILVLIVITLLLFVIHIFSEVLYNRTVFSQTGMGEENIKASSLSSDHLKDIREASMLSYEDVADLEHLEIALVSDETYEIIKNKYYQINFFEGFQTGDKENNRTYLEKFYYLIEEDVSFTLYGSKKKADGTRGKKYYLSDYGELDTHSTELPFVPEDYLYYFFDMSGDGIPELCITSKDYGNQFVYIFQYREETDEIILWHKLNNGNYGVLGTGKIGYSHYGLASGAYHLFYQLDRVGNIVCQVLFLTYFERKTGEEVALYMVGIPEYFSMKENDEIKKEIIERPYKVSNTSGTYYRVSEEQFEELTKEFFEAQKLAEEKLQEVTYTYQELLELSEEK